MREIDALTITNAVKKLCIDANYHLGDDIKNCILNYAKNETWPVAKGILDQIIENYKTNLDYEQEFNIT